MINIKSKDNSGGGGAGKMLQHTKLFGLLLGLAAAGQTVAGENVVMFDTQASGEKKAVDLWGFDTAWLWDANVIRGVNFLGKDKTDVIRFSFTGDTPLVDTNGDGVNDDLSGAGLDEFNFRMYLVDTYTDSHTALYLNNDTDDWATNPYLVVPYNDGVDASKWAELIAVTTKKATDHGRKVLSVAPFNEPDYGHWQGDVTRFGDVVWQLRWSGKFPEFSYGANPFIRIMGPNTLNNDVARSWGYDQLNNWGMVEEGNTHQLAGNMWSFIDFYNTVKSNGDVATNDELHNVMEAMVGAQYGLNTGIWWGTAGRTRSEFMKTSDGMRLAYSENPWDWTAASVYRSPEGKLQAFIGESERQAQPTTYHFVSKDRPAFFDGYGPQRIYDVTTTGGSGYQTSNHRNAERMVNITWGEDAQPVIDGRYVLVNRATGQVMEVIGGSTDNGAFMQQTAYVGSNNQQWEVHPIPSTRGGDYSYFKFAAGHSGKAPDVYGFSLSDGGDIRQWEQATNPDWPYPGDNQVWFLSYVENGWFKIGNGWSGLYIGTDGNKIVQRADSSDYAQQWRLVPVGAVNPSDLVAPAKPIGVSATANAASVTVKWKANADTDIAGYNLLRSTQVGGPYDMVARGVKGTSFTDNTANKAIPYYYVLQAVDKSLNRSVSSGETSATPTGLPALVAKYDFQQNAKDSTINSNNGVLKGAHFSPWGLGGSALDLKGDSYVSLPSEIVNHDQVTIAAWVYWHGGASWQRIFDFGNGEGESLYLSPANWSGNTMQFSMFKTGVGSSELFAPAPAIDTWVHVAVVLGNGTAQLYVNGALADSTNTTIKPSDFNPLVNYIGKSQYADPLFNGLVDDFRIYNTALTGADVAALAAASTVAPPAETPIVLINPSFEEPNVGKVWWGFDDANPTYDVPGWNESGPMFDSGIDNIGSGYAGQYAAYLRGATWLSDPIYSVYQTTSHVIAAGEVYRLNFEAKANWTWYAPNGQITGWLYYDDGGSRMVIGSVAVDAVGWTAGSLTVKSDDHPEAIGHTIGVEFKNTGIGWSDFDAVTLTKSDVTAPAILVTATPNVLVPADHKMRDVGLKVTFFDNNVNAADIGVACKISSSEPDDGVDDGNTTGDVDGHDGYTAKVTIPMLLDGTQFVSAAKLRAERSDSGSGRVYGVECVATDAKGRTSESSTKVIVPL